MLVRYNASFKEVAIILASSELLLESELEVLKIDG